MKGKNKNKKQTDKTRDIQKKQKEYFSESKPDDQKSLSDRISNQDPKIREIAYITLSTFDITSNREIADEVFSDEISQKVINALNDPIKKNALCIFSAIGNILTTSDYLNKIEVLEFYLKNGLIDTICKNIKAIAIELTESKAKLFGGELEKLLSYIEESYRLLDTIVSLEIVCVEDNLSYISQHETLLEMTIEIMISKECEFIKKDNLWINESIIYWITHFLYSLSKDNINLCTKLKSLQELEEYMILAHESMDESNSHICVNLSGLCFNLCIEENGRFQTDSELFTKLVHGPILKILTEMKSPQEEFNENFSDNIESIKEAISSNNEDEEEIASEKKPSNAKLTQMLSDFLNEMSTQVKKWKNFSLSNITSFEILKDIVHHMNIKDSSKQGKKTKGKDNNQNNELELIKSMFLSEISSLNCSKRLIDCVILRLNNVKLKSKINLDEMHNIGQIIVDIQSAAVEVLINLLIECEDIFTDEAITGAVLSSLLNDMKHQHFNSKIVNSGLRFLALFAKHFPQVLKQVLEEHKVTDSFLSLIEMVQNHEVITHGITIITAIYSNSEATMEQHEKVCFLLLKHLGSGNLRVICETLNALFDIYPNETYDEVLSKLNVIPILENSIDNFYQKLESEQENYDKDELEFFEETLNNLQGFLEYKRSNMK